ncbi:MAG: DUF4294 domain-containing protein [Bacteroidales bacterium]|nr:DUF4294 domain-containing protein [Bacteroidales bacterium]
MKRILVIAILALIASTPAFSQAQKKVNFIRNGSTLLETTAKKFNDRSPQKSESTADEQKYNVVYGQINGNDTMLIVYLPEVDIDLMNRYYEISSTRKGRHLVRNVRKVYPYAKLAGQKMKEIDEMLANISNSSERSRLMKKAEDEITAQYTEDLKNLTFQQGAILIRLIDRETGNTSYQVVRELRGTLRAFFYQGFARLWGYNLKTEYDPHSNREDDQIETIVTLLERGQI